MKWKTARVFICSTFADMVAERDMLMTQVFPRLRPELDERRIHLVAVDLNWGVASDETDTGVILQIVDDELNRASFIIAILGERFGAIPPGEFDSWTALSIYAALSSKTAKLLLFRRSTDLTDELAVTAGVFCLDNYHETHDAPRLEQQKLLRRLAWLKVLLTPYRSIQEFGDLVIRDLGTAVKEAFKPRGTIFISYSRNDIQSATRVQEMLESAGFTVWLDVKGISLGDEWLQKITSAIDECDAVLMLASNESIRSEYVIREIHYAFAENKPILAYHLETIELPPDMKFLLGPVQHIDARAFGTFESAIDAIVSGLDRQLLSHRDHRQA